MSIVRAICQPMVLPMAIGVGANASALPGPANPWPAFVAAQVTYNYSGGGYDGPLPDPTVAAATLASVQVNDNPLITQPLPDFSGCASLNEFYVNQAAPSASLAGTLDCSIFPATVSDVEVSNNGFTQVTNIGGLTGLVYFYADGCPLVSISSLAGCVSIQEITLVDCGLSSSEIDGVLVDLVATAANNGYAALTGNAAPGAAGLAAKTTLEGRGWTVDVDA